MKHAVIIDKPNNINEKCIEVSLMSGRNIYLAQVDYSQEELDQFNSEANNWVLNCRGNQCFLADSDSGEDADGYYCEYFDITKEMAVFDKGKFVGIYICPDGLSYSGNGRSSFRIDRRIFHDIFINQSMAKKMHVFLFANEETYRWNDWILLKRDPDVKYESYLLF